MQQDPRQDQEEEIGENVENMEEEGSSIKRQSAKYVLSLKSKHGITDTAIEDIIETTQGFVSDIVTTMENKIEAKCRERGIELEIDMKDLFDPAEMFSGLSSQTQRKQYFKDNFNFLVSFINITIIIFAGGACPSAPPHDNNKNNKSAREARKIRKN